MAAIVLAVFLLTRAKMGAKQASEGNCARPPGGRPGSVSQDVVLGGQTKMTSAP